MMIDRDGSHNPRLLRLWGLDGNITSQRHDTSVNAKRDYWHVWIELGNVKRGKLGSEVKTIYT